MPINPDNYLVTLCFSAIFNKFCSDSSNDFDHDRYLSDLFRQSTVDLFYKKASILHSNLFRMTYEALKQHGFDRPPHTPPNSRYSWKIAWIIYPGDDFKTERDFATVPIAQHRSKSPGAKSSTVPSTPQAGPSSVVIISLGFPSYNSSFLSPPALPTATDQAQAS